MNSNAFELTLREVRGGAAVNELSEELAKVVAAVRDTGKTGTLTLALKIRPAGKGIGCLVVEDNVTAKVPRLEREGSLFYPTDQNTLQRNDPRQKEFELKEVPALKQEIKQVAVNQ